MSNETTNPNHLGDLTIMKKCKHGVYGLCTKCAYLNTGRRKATDSFIEKDVIEFMESSMNKRLKETYP